MICCDQYAAIMNAVRNHIPTTVITLDDWHLNKNQRKNVVKESERRKKALLDELQEEDFQALEATSILATSKRGKRKDLNNELHALRQSAIEE